MCEPRPVRDGWAGCSVDQQLNQSADVLDHVVHATAGVDVEVVGRIGVLDRDGRGQSGHIGARAVALDVDVVDAVRAVDVDGVDRAVGGGAAERSREIELVWVTSVPVRSLTVTVSAPARALKSTISTSLVSIVTLPWTRKKSSLPAIGATT